MNKFMQRIDFNKNRQDMLNLQNMGDNDTEFSMMTSEIQRSSVMQMTGLNSPDLKLNHLMKAVAEKQIPNPYSKLL